MTLNQLLEATLRHYVLGELEEPQRLEIEKRLVTDPDTFDALGVIEQELSEEYLEGALSGDERTQFERHYLTSSDRRRQLEFIRLLRQHATSAAGQPEPEPAPGPIGWLAGIAEFVRVRPAWAVSLAGVTIAGAAALWIVSGRRAPDVPVDDQKPAPTVAAPQPVPAPAAGLQPAPPEPAPSAPPPSQLVAPRPEPPTFALSPGLLRDQGSLRRVDLPAGAQAVRLRLELQNGGDRSYRAAVLDAQGGEIWAQAGLPAERGAVTIVIPARVLTRGDYQVVLSRTATGGRQEPLATYNFRVRTR